MGDIIYTTRTEEQEPVTEELKVPKLSARYADESYKLFDEVHVRDPTPEEARKIRNKSVLWILPFLCIGYHLMFLDKQTASIVQRLGQAEMRSNSS